MRALSMTQPWASLLITGVKRIETRGFRPHVAEEGDVIAIHAALRMNANAIEICKTETYRNGLRQCACLTSEMETRVCPPELCEIPWHDHSLPKRNWPYDFDVRLLPRGVILGTVTLEWFEKTNTLRDKLHPYERSYGDYTDGRWGWKVREPLMLREPIPCKGRLGLWETSKEIENNIGLQLYG